MTVGVLLVVLLIRPVLRAAPKRCRQSRRPGRKHAEGGRGLLNEPPPTDDLLRPLDLAAAEIADGVAFLETLTEKGLRCRRLRPTLARCPRSERSAPLNARGVSA